MAKSITLTRGYFASVDDEDFDWVNQWRWHFDDRYAARVENGCKIYMHVEICLRHDLGYVEVDHKDQNKINNQKSNLRNSTPSQQTANQQRRSDNTSGYKGVTWLKRDRKWKAQICHNGTVINLGHYHDKVEAAKVRDREAIRLFGEFAVLNFPER